MPAGVTRFKYLSIPATDQRWRGANVGTWASCISRAFLSHHHQRKGTVCYWRVSTCFSQSLFMFHLFVNLSIYFAKISWSVPHFLHVFFFLLLICMLMCVATSMRLWMMEHYIIYQLVCSGLQWPVVIWYVALSAAIFTFSNTCLRGRSFFKVNHACTCWYLQGGWVTGPDWGLN